jgi:hypothetical protein
MPSGNGASGNIKDSLTVTTSPPSEVLAKVMSPAHSIGMPPLTSSYVLSLPSLLTNFTSPPPLVIYLPLQTLLMPTTYYQEWPVLRGYNSKLTLFLLIRLFLA